MTRRKISHESITSTLVKNGSLYAIDFDANSLPVGPTGPQGPKGDKGAISQVTVRSNAVDVTAGHPGVVTASCTSDERAAGGGSSWTITASESGIGLNIVSLAPSYDSYGVTGYTARGANTSDSTHRFTVSALCCHR